MSCHSFVVYTNISNIEILKFVDYLRNYIIGINAIVKFAAVVAELLVLRTSIQKTRVQILVSC